MEQVTAADIRELMNSRAIDPALVRWTDTDEIEVVSSVLFSDISYTNRARPNDVLISRDELMSQGDWDTEHPTDADCQAFAEMLSEQ